MKAYERLMLARGKDRASASDYFSRLFDGFIEMHGDRRFGDDKAVIAGLATFHGKPVTLIGIEKGKNIKERVAKNFGCAHPEGYRKALLQMKQAEKFDRPVICFVDTAGAYCGIGAEERGQGQAVAECLYEMSVLKVPCVTVITGEGGSGGALALSVADEIWMLENAVFSVISPEGCASILWKDAKKAQKAAECLKITADDLLSLKIIDEIISEEGGLEEICKKLDEMLVLFLNKQRKKTVDTLIKERYEKYRNIGRFL
jgi:acetyl-CoA carboxylase carboxyl transferase subunit alpha